MEIIQIRVPKPILDRADDLIKAKLFRSRSEVFRHAIQEFLLKSNYNGVAPFIVGPFGNPEVFNNSDLLKSEALPTLEIARLNKDLRPLLKKVT